MCLLYAVSLRVGCVKCYTATEGCVCVLRWKTADLLCLNRVNAALDHQSVVIATSLVLDF